MPDHDAAMLAFVKLSGISQDRGQLGPRDKFLVLAAAAACQAGWTSVAERCRELILAHNGVHLLRRYPKFVDAVRADEFQTFLKQIERFCSYEKAEYLLAQQALTPDLPPLAARLSPGDYALLLLGHSDRRRDDEKQSEP